MAGPQTLLSKLGQNFRFLGSVEPVKVTSDKLVARHARHFFEIRIGEDDLRAVVRNDDAFIQRFEDSFYLGEPFRLFDFHKNSSCGYLT